MTLTLEQREELEAAIIASLGVLFEEMRAVVFAEAEKQARKLALVAVGAEDDTDEAAAALLLLLPRDERRRTDDDDADGPTFDPSKIPAATWKDFEARTRGKLEAELAAIHLLAFTQQSRELLDDDNEQQLQAAAVKAAGVFAEERAKVVAEEMTANTVAAVALIGLVQNQSAMQSELDKVFGANRAENVGITETTQSLSAGQMDAGRRYERITGQSVAYLWTTEMDDKVCRICYPLDRQPRAVWEGKFPQGPPAHPRCRCALRLVVETLSSGGFV